MTIERDRDRKSLGIYKFEGTVQHPLVVENNHRDLRELDSDHVCDSDSQDIRVIGQNESGPERSERHTQSGYNSVSMSSSTSM